MLYVEGEIMKKEIVMMILNVLSLTDEQEATDVQITICKYPYKLKNAQVDSDTLHAFTYDNHRGYRFQFSTVDSLQLVRCVAQTISDLGEADQNGIKMLEKNHPIYLTLSPYLIYILLDKNKKFEYVKRHNVGLRLNVVEERVRIKPKHCLRWMAPEAAVNQKGTIKSAVFSLSFVLWELLAGKQPLEEQLRRLSRKMSVNKENVGYEEDLDARACEMIYQGERPNVEEIFRSGIWKRGRKGPKAAEKLEKLLLNCWDPNPDARMTMSEMEKELGVILKEFSKMFWIKDTIIHDCSANEDETHDVPPTGYGGGIFLTGSGDYDVSSRGLNLNGLKMYENTASRRGQSIYIAMAKVVEWCKLGIAGEYVKGNYSDTQSDKHELEGIPLTENNFNQSTTQQIIQQQNFLQTYWDYPKGLIWHVSNRDVTPTENDLPGCALVDSPCCTIEYALKQISLEKEFSETATTSEKRIGITEYGFDLNSPIKFDPPTSYTNVIKIMKQLSGTDEQLAEQAELKLNKEDNDSNIENGNQGWISAIEGIKLSINGIIIITDQSKLIIPIINIYDSNSQLDLNSVTFSGINLSPTSEAKGIIHININNQQFNLFNCTFEDIEIENKGGNVIRLLNDNSFPFSSIIKNTLFKNINSVGDSNGQGGSAIFAEKQRQKQNYF
ncbi:MAG: hypothetical protein EZS28_030282 [Streblomastix strix]|uniref:Protein kinase domain-containing protein n=1 Tax=Streblomastix strix TaxID=222440 RepID=A0A5J4UWD0_9EUKA|nr:MAG: hypothetical protein EZS28_030282 [Streblomastix strix]